MYKSVKEGSGKQEWNVTTAPHQPQLEARKNQAARATRSPSRVKMAVCPQSGRDPGGVLESHPPRDPPGLRMIGHRPRASNTPSCWAPSPGGGQETGVHGPPPPYPQPPCSLEVVLCWMCVVESQ